MSIRIENYMIYVAGIKVRVKRFSRYFLSRNNLMLMETYTTLICRDSIIFRLQMFCFFIVEQKVTILRHYNFSFVVAFISFLECCEASSRKFKLLTSLVLFWFSNKVNDETLVSYIFGTHIFFTTLLRRTNYFLSYFSTSLKLFLVKSIIFARIVALS